MNMPAFFSAQLEREAPICKRVLERVPEGRPDWRPHDKSMPLGYLATLVASMPSWVAMAVSQNELDLNPPGGSTYKPAEWQSTADLLRVLDESVETIGRMKGLSADSPPAPPVQLDGTAVIRP